MGLQSYQASAGSGKTFQLALRYLQLCFQSEENRPYRKILAITFTNKAAIEMKERVLDTLVQIAEHRETGTSASLFAVLKETTGLRDEQLRVKSADLLAQILHDYSRFSLQTIDSFTQRIVQSFAQDLQLPLNFETELDQEVIVEQAVGKILEKQQENRALNKLLKEFAESSFEDQQTFKLSDALMNQAKTLLSSKSSERLELLKEIDKEQVLGSLQELRVKRRNFLKQMKKLVDEFFSVCSAPSDMRVGVETQLKEFSSMRVTTGWALKSNASKCFSGLLPFYAKTKKKDESEELVLLAKAEEIVRLYEKEFSSVFLIDLQLKQVYQELLLADLSKAIKEVYLEQNVMHISEFDKLIAKTLADQPVPFIYERIGERYKSFFIDEFQDTSRLQWGNILPLIENAIASGGMGLLVGDAKQSIYRFRGGSVDQFVEINSSPEGYPLRDRKHAVHLVHHEPGFTNTNYRSLKEVVHFNNELYAFCANKLDEPAYQQLFKEANQKAFKDHGGFVEVNCLPSVKDDESTNEWLIEKVQQSIDAGYKPGDIAVLCRDGKKGQDFANCLMEHKYNVVSADSLKLIQNPRALRVLNILRFLDKPKDQTVALGVYQDLIEMGAYQPEGELDYEVKDQNFVNLINAFYPIELWTKLSLLPLVESISMELGLMLSDDPFLMSLQDLAYQFTKSGRDDVHSFLEFLDKKDPAVELPADENAIQVLTIHKSKGLEYPVVILPLFKTEVYKSSGKYLVDIRNDQTAILPSVMASYSEAKLLKADYSEQVEEQRREVHLDALNTLYVATTRAEEALFIGTHEKSKNGKTEKVGYWINEFCEITNGATYMRGELKSESIAQAKPDKNEHEIVFPKELANWEEKLRISKTHTDQFGGKEEQRYGNVLHQAMEVYAQCLDLGKTLNRLLHTGKVKAAELNSFEQSLLEIIQHEELKDVFKDKSKLRAEWSFKSALDLNYRPDLVFEDDEELIVIDYKTGKQEKKHIQQIQQYMTEIAQFSQKKVAGKLIYTHTNQVEIVKV